MMNQWEKKKDEVWTDINIVGFEGCYQLSNYFRVRNIVKRSGTRVGKILVQQNQTGYFVVCLSKNGIKKTYGIATLVALQHMPNPCNKPEVNHINGIKTDNRPENLEWVTASENTKHAFRTGLLVPIIHSDSTKQKISSSMMGKQNSLGRSYSDYEKEKRSQVCKKNWRNQYSK